MGCLPSLVGFVGAHPNRVQDDPFLLHPNCNTSAGNEGQLWTAPFALIVLLRVYVALDAPYDAVISPSGHLRKLELSREGREGATTTANTCVTQRPSNAPCTCLK